jgi:cytochrome oxidase Cu insertion factor (SCO1/SenC/PrrC family)
MQHLTNEHEPQAFTRSSPRYLRGLILFILVGLGGGSLWYGQGRVPRVGGDRPLDQLGNFGVVPEFTLTERSERRVTRNDLLGRVWVVNFFYASCLDTCPLQSAEMANLQRDLADAPDVRLVSISVDPDHDTPESLRAYAQRFGADPERWLFLTGDKAAIVRLAQDGFHLSVVAPGAAPPQKSDAPILGKPLGAQSPLPSRRRQTRYLTLPPALLSGLLGMVAPTAALAHGGIAHQPMLHSARFVLVDRQARLRGYYHSDEKAGLRRLRRDVRTVLREPSVKE